VVGVFGMFMKPRGLLLSYGEALMVIVGLSYKVAKEERYLWHTRT
jgi:hypothetical protein